MRIMRRIPDTSAELRDGGVNRRTITLNRVQSQPITNKQAGKKISQLNIGRSNRINRTNIRPRQPTTPIMAIDRMRGYAVRTVQKTNDVIGGT